MDWLAIVSIVLMGIAIFMFVYGWRKQSQMLIFLGGLAFITPIFYLIGWGVLAPLVPVIAMLFLIYAKRRFDSKKTA
ncbi:MAG: hypothetical protein ACK4M9_22680 [Anaerobacillus sp.]|uniref:hypothetical protein n=1 Tax=Anaerobacillus sp. TaxID=1872506 RepID=UPI003919308B